MNECRRKEDDYKRTNVNKNPDSTSVFDNEEEDGVETGDCPFIVHGLTGDQIDTKTTKELKAIALRHLNSQGKREDIFVNPHVA